MLKLASLRIKSTLQVDLIDVQLNREPKIKSKKVSKEDTLKPPTTLPS